VMHPSGVYRKLISARDLVCLTTTKPYFDWNLHPAS